MNLVFKSRCGSQKLIAAQQRTCWHNHLNLQDLTTISVRGARTSNDLTSIALSLNNVGAILYTEPVACDRVIFFSI